MVSETDPVKISTKVYKNIDVRMLTEALLLMQKQTNKQNRQKEGKREEREGEKERKERMNLCIHQSRRVKYDTATLTMESLKF